MEKPIVFFSHSSKDDSALNSLKKLILTKTGNSIEIFLSSDGQSIPFGKNWVYTIQENLEKSSIMFVFISPSSVNSNWLYFESGFAYSNNIKVIPVGILGIDLNQLSPPLSLLQGFNLKDPESLKNLIAIINDEYSTSFSLDISNEEYNNTFGLSYTGKLAPEIFSVVFDIELRNNFPLSKHLKTLLTRKGLEYIENEGNELLSRGIWIIQHISEDINNITYRIEISSNLLVDFFDAFMEIFPLDASNTCISFRTRLNFSKGFTIDWHSATRAGKLYGTRIKLIDENKFSFLGKDFEFIYYQTSEKRSDISFDFVNIEGDIDFNWISNLAQTLIDNKVVYPKS